MENKGVSGQTSDIYQRPALVTSPEEAKSLLLEGNRRFVAGGALIKDITSDKRNELVLKGQKPFAVVLTCSDSRVPPELVFDQGLGDLFVIRVAGNVVDQTVMSSVLYGAEHLQAPLVLVLGHDHCGAVKATVDGEEVPGISNKIKPLVDRRKSEGITGDSLCRKVEDDNIEAVLVEITNNSEIKHLLQEGQLKVLAAKYNLQSGEVELF
ncbi:carbonic anhydrase [Syntrophomonas erecta]